MKGMHIPTPTHGHNRHTKQTNQPTTTTPNHQQANDENVERRRHMRQPSVLVGGGFTPLKPEFHRMVQSTLLAHSHSPGTCP